MILYLAIGQRSYAVNSGTMTISLLALPRGDQPLKQLRSGVKLTGTRHPGVDGRAC